MTAELRPQFEGLENGYISAIISRLGFSVDDSVQPRERGWYGQGRRVFLIHGTYEGQQAVLKIMNDLREQDADKAYQRFLEIPDRGSLTVPALLHTEHGPQYTVLILAELPEGARSPHSPLSAQHRKAFLLGPFADLERIAPQLAYRQPTNREQLSPEAFCASRFDAWRRLAVDARSVQGHMHPEIESVLDGMALLQQQVEKGIAQTHAGTSLEWMHGMPKPDKFHAVAGAPEGDIGMRRLRFFLTDFKLVGLKPRGYDLAVAIWADAIMPVLSQRGLNVPDAVKKIDTAVKAWVADAQYAHALGRLPNYAPYLRSMLMERLVGSIYADTLGNRQLADIEAIRRVNILERYLQHCVESGND